MIIDFCKTVSFENENCAKGGKINIEKFRFGGLEL
jgi:hypothetical protein